MLEYDYANRLTSAGGSEYTYDLEGHRVGVNEDGIAVEYVVNPTAGLSQVLTRTKDGRTTYYIYGLGLIGEECGDEYRAYHYDLRGSTVALTGEEGTISDRMTYTPTGELVWRDGESDTPFLYCGEYGVQTDGNGLLYMRARYYSPEIGRFLGEDSVVGSLSVTGSLNRYAYCGGNPVSYVDPEGEFAESVVGWYNGLSPMQKIIMGTGFAAIGTGLVVLSGGTAATAIAGTVGMLAQSAALGEALAGI